MTSEQVQRSFAVILLAAMLAGCTAGPWVKRPQGPIPRSLYADRVLWAVAPLRNESGSRFADGLKMADRLANTLQTVDQIDVVPVNRVLSAMEALKMSKLQSPQDVMRIAKTLGVDGILVGTITAYDPYDPPKLGLQIELYLRDAQSPGQTLDVRKLVQSGTGASWAGPSRQSRITPASVATAMLDASNPTIRQRLHAFASERGGGMPGKKSWWRHLAVSKGLLEKDDTDWHLYRINMNLFTEYASYELAERLLQAESQRLGLSQRRPER